MKVALAAAAVLVFPSALAGCGDQSSDQPEPGRSGAAEWVTEHLPGAVAVDFPTHLVTDGDDAIVLMLSDDGVLQSYLSLDGAPFEPGEPLDLGEKYAAVGDVVRLADGSWYALGNAGVEEVDGDEEFTYDPLALRSEDGLTWASVEVSGFADAVEVNDLEVVDSRIVVAGDYRTLADPGNGGFEAHVWTSADGRVFDEVSLPDVSSYHGYDDESYVGDVVIVDGALLAAGRIGGTALLWRSEDGGDAWIRVDDPLLRDVYSISGLGVVGSTVVASTAGTDTSAIRSNDGGMTWEAVAALPLDGEAEGWAPLWTGAGRFVTLTGIDDSTWSSPEVCYADLDQCGQDPEPRLVASQDGMAWSGVEVPGEVDEIAGTDDGRLLVMVAEQGGVAVHSWPAGADLPAAAEPAVPQTVELVTLPEGEQPEIGVRYHLPLYTHCGIEQIWFGDQAWRRTDDGPGYETGAGDDVPDGWPVPERGGNVYGYATVGADGVLDYTTEDGTVLATYEQGGRPLGCE